MQGILKLKSLCLCFYWPEASQPATKKTYSKSSPSYWMKTLFSLEPPYKKSELDYCKRCQWYRHTKTYCYHPSRCVKCGENHDSTTCITTPPPHKQVGSLQWPASSKLSRLHTLYSLALNIWPTFLLEGIKTSFVIQNPNPHSMSYSPNIKLPETCSTARPLLLMLLLWAVVLIHSCQRYVPQLDHQCWCCINELHIQVMRMLV